ncbi:hypothetical protein C0Q70_12900 [Pomacea canaliculata]|uniref:Uncharacterized protein n=1 Tax=Pomacea canaliculata TaxID=400727 RepID=A0A2T7P2U4_POMCA|nr:hypothetical protein C0Q70_12900 [Pomacea canaliculata]
MKPQLQAENPSMMFKRLERFHRRAPGFMKKALIRLGTDGWYLVCSSSRWASAPWRPLLSSTHPGQRSRRLCAN